jgi:conjugal transfer mating pair stabilization protein TraN
VGSQKENFQTSQVFCCFPTKIARILHEQGRAQLGISWGDASSPECRGFSLSELQQVDFTKIDLSDAIEDLSIDKQELLQKVRATIDRLQAGGGVEGKENTEKMVDILEQVKNGS